MLRGGVTCAKCGTKKSIVRYFSSGGVLVAVCDDCWRRMNKNERREFLRSFREEQEKGDVEHDGGLCDRKN